MEETERILADTQKRQQPVTQTYLPTTTDSRLELNQQVKRFASKEQSFEREILSLKSALKTLDRDKDEMRVELDHKDERLAKLQSDVGQYLEELARLQLRLKNSEIQIG